jgi:hypothetical protein
LENPGATSGYVVCMTRVSRATSMLSEPWVVRLNLFPPLSGLREVVPLWVQYFAYLMLVEQPKQATGTIQIQG